MTTIDIKESNLHNELGIRVERFNFSAKIHIYPIGASFRVGGRNCIKLETLNKIMKFLKVELTFINTGDELIYN